MKYSFLPFLFLLLIASNTFAQSPEGTLPIELNTWTATSLSKSVSLKWSTETETNNDFITIERSDNGITWSEIGIIEGSGTTSTREEYTFEDTKPIDGTSYYRLKQTDFNGDYSYTSVKCITRAEDNDNAFIAYSNTAINAFILEGEQIAAYPIELYSMMGKKISSVLFNTINASKVVISIQNIPSGTYVIKACNNTKTIVKN